MKTGQEVAAKRNKPKKKWKGGRKSGKDRICFRKGCWKRLVWSKQEKLREVWQNYRQRSSSLYFQQTSRWWNRGGGNWQDMLCYVMLQGREEICRQNFCRKKPKWKIHLSRLKGRMENNVRTNLKNIWRYRLDLYKQRNQRSEFVHVVMNNVTVDMFRPVLSDYVHENNSYKTLGIRAGFKLPSFNSELCTWTTSFW